MANYVDDIISESSNDRKVLLKLWIKG